MGSLVSSSGEYPNHQTWYNNTPSDSTKYATLWSTMNSCSYVLDPMLVMGRNRGGTPRGLARRWHDLAGRFKLALHFECWAVDTAGH